jgi:ATP-dependent protease ClpP protease subunit
MGFRLMPDLVRLHNLAGQLAEQARPRGRNTRGRGARWYDIRNAVDGRTVVYLYDMIGDDYFGGGVSARDFVDEINAVSSPVVELHINSEGGEVFDGIAIYESLKQHPARVEVVIDSLAASAASFVAMAGDSVAMARNARLMIHDAAIGGAYGSGNAKDMREFQQDVGKLADLLDEMSMNIADIYAQRAGETVQHWRDLMLAETWFSASQAKEVGLVDSILGESSTVPVDSTTDPEGALDVDALLAAFEGAWDVG